MVKGNTKVELEAQKRSVAGRKVKSLRDSGLIPAVIYGKGMEAMNLQIPAKDFSKTLQQAGESTLVYLNVDGEAYPTIIHDVERDYLSGTPIHADFYKVNLKEKIKAMVPVVFEGESPAVKNLGGIFVRNINEIEVEALPQDLPHEVTLDISKLENIDDHISLKDIKLGDGVTVHGEMDAILATIQAPMSEEELQKSLEGESTDVSEVEVIEKEKKEEEAAAEEGAAAEAPAAE